MNLFIHCNHRRVDYELTKQLQGTRVMVSPGVKYSWDSTFLQVDGDKYSKEYILRLCTFIAKKLRLSDFIYITDSWEDINKEFTDDPAKDHLNWTNNNTGRYYA